VRVLFIVSSYAQPVQPWENSAVMVVWEPHMPLSDRENDPQTLRGNTRTLTDKLPTRYMHYEREDLQKPISTQT